MAQIKSVTRQNPCPVCGKPDFCFWREREKDPGYFNLYCNRTSEAKGTIITGKDGKDYLVIYQSNTATIFEEKNQRAERTKHNVSGEKKEYTPRNFTVMDSITPLTHQKLDQVYRCMMSHLPLFKFHAKYLAKEGWSMKLIREHGICSMPAANIRKLPASLKGSLSRTVLAARVMQDLSMKSLAGVPGAYINEQGSWTFHAKSGILFPVYDSDGLIYRMRIRMDYLDLPVTVLEDSQGFYYLDKGIRIELSMSGAFKWVDNQKIFMDFPSHKGKYRNFSSYKMDAASYQSGYIQNAYNKGCEAKNALLYAFHASDNFSVWWITEAKKSILCKPCIETACHSSPRCKQFCPACETEKRKNTTGNTAGKGCQNIYYRL